MALLEFSGVSKNNITDLSFTLTAGEIAIVRAATAVNQEEIIDLALGEAEPEQGNIRLHGQPLTKSAPGHTGWIAAHGGLINNLKIWENITLPLWYHGQREPANVEKTVTHWLQTLGIEPSQWTDFMANSPARLSTEQRKVAGLLRGLVQAPSLLVIKAGLWLEVAQPVQDQWNTALEKFVYAEKNRAILVVAEGAISLPWKILKDAI